MHEKEKQLLLGFLEELSDRFGNDGCNDFKLQDTQENREFAERYNNWCKEANPTDPPLIKFHNKEVYTMNYMLLSYIQHIIEHGQ